MNEFMTPIEVCGYTRMSRTTLWRQGPKGTGELCPIKIGRMCLYKRSDVDAFMTSHLVSTVPSGC